MKSKRVFERNLWNLFAFLILLCEFDTKNQVEIINEFTELLNKLDTIGLLSIIKRLVSTRGTYDTNQRHNKAMAHMNLYEPTPR